MSFGQYPYQPPKQRHSAAIYRRRRAVVGVAIVVGGYVVFSIGSAMFSGTAAPTLEAADNSVPQTSLNVAPTVTAPGQTALISTTTSTISPNREPRQVSTESPAILYIAGDSDAGTFGPYLEKLMDSTGYVKTTLDYKVSSGLSRPDFYDWGARFNEQVPLVDPDIVVVTFGGNDAQGLTDLGGEFQFQQPTGEANGDQEWRAEYGRRVGATMDYLSAGGRTLIWVGIPNDDNPDVTARMSVQNEVVRAQAAARPEVLFVDTWARFSGIDGGWAEYVVDPRDGVGKDVRANDGFHLNENGAEILALDIADVLKSDLRKRGASL